MINMLTSVFKEWITLILWSDSFFNLLNVLCVILPVLLGVAFMTIIERKQLAAHQRRVGPNAVGLDNKNYKKDLCWIKRFDHSTFDDKSFIINNLYKNRIAPIKTFDSDVIDTCYNWDSKEQRDLFLNKFKDKGGIYLIQYKNDQNIFYIGRTKNFKNRFYLHSKIKLKDKFHLFANLVGLDKFNFSIIEICELNIQKERENFYLKKYLPLLNTVFKSNFNASQIFETLYSKLKAKQINLNFNNKYLGIPIYVYTYNEEISDKFLRYESINILSKEIEVARDIIKRFLNTYVPYKNYLIFSYAIKDFNLINDLISESKKRIES